MSAKKTKRPHPLASPSPSYKAELRLLMHHLPGRVSLWSGQEKQDKECMYKVYVQSKLSLLSNDFTRGVQPHLPATNSWLCTWCLSEGRLCSPVILKTVLDTEDLNLPTFLRKKFCINGILYHYWPIRLAIKHAGVKCKREIYSKMNV